jgi:molybdopterin converting factor subunit 1
MRVRLLYFGVLKDLRGLSEELLEMPAEATVATLLTVVRAQTSNATDGLWRSLAVAVNREYASRDQRIQDGDEVALLPPVSGGTMRVELVRERIDAEAIAAAIKAAADGAVCVFDGIVRNNTRGRATLHLDYEAYEEMALEKMRGLANDAIARFGVREVAIVHRLGRLVVGETSILIAVASAHRGAAFDACRFVIDTLKKTVPIWKKEQFVDGVVWADGEPFPPEIAAGNAPSEQRGIRLMTRL